MTDKLPDLRTVFSPSSRLQRYLDVEAALALAQADLGIVPPDAAAKIAAVAHVGKIDLGRLATLQEKTGHFIVPIVDELSRVAGDAGGWVHWGATSQNIQQTGDTLGLRIAADVLEARLRALLLAMADLGDRSAAMLMAGRTHWQQAVPITFGFKVATWSDVMIRHLERLQQLRPRLLVSMTGGAVGNFASLGAAGPAVQVGVAKRLGLTPMAVPARNIVDHFAELVLLLGMVAASSVAIAEEIARLMSAEFREVSERLPEGDVGSSTMPQKRNAKLCIQIVTRTAEIRAMGPMALEAMVQAHEVDGGRSAMMDRAVEQSCVLSDEVLCDLTRVIAELELYPERMRQNLALTQGLISAEAVMMSLATRIGRQEAHDIVHHAAHIISTKGGLTFAEALTADKRLSAHLSPAEIARLLDPAGHTGLSETIAREAVARARVASGKH